MSVDFLPKNFPPFQVHHAKKPPRFYPDGFQRNVIDFYLFFRIVGSEKPYICSFPILYGPYVDTVGKNKKTIEEYIRNQLQEDIACDQMSLFEPVDPFTGKKVQRNRNNPLRGDSGMKCSWQTFLSPLKGQCP